MTPKALTSILATTALTLAAGLALAQSGPMQQQHGPQYTGSDRTGAVAALEPATEDGSWGRLMVRDRELPTGPMRDVMGRLFGLAPEADFTVWVDGLELAVVTTDPGGDAWLRLQSPGRNFPEVPADLPAAAEVATATVTDASGTVVLEGSFVDMPEPVGPGADLVYLERIRLVDPSDGLARGIARVGRDGEDTQWFETFAGHLVPGAQYRVEVDGLLAGTTTAGVAGHAELELSTTGSGDVLPESLQPIEELRLVQWFAEDGTVVLEGSFTGTNMVGFGGPNGGGNGWQGQGPHGDGDCDGSGGVHHGGDGGNGGDNGGGNGDGNGGDNGGGNGGGNGDGNGGGNGG